MDHEEVAARLVALLAEGQLGTRSQWALETALKAAETESVAGWMVVEIPAKVKDRVDVHFTAGRCELVNRFGEGR